MATTRLLQPLLSLAKSPPPGADFTIELGTIPPLPTPTPPPGLAGTRPELNELARVLAAGPSSAAPPPDVVLMITVDDAVYAGAKGLVRPLDPYFQSSATAKREDFYPAALAAVTAQGHTWGMPLALSPLVLVYDPDVFADAGVIPPTTSWSWEEFVDACSKLTKPAAKRYALFPVDYLASYVYLGGGSVLTGDGRRSALTEPGALAGVGYYQELAQQLKVVVPQGPCSQGPPLTCGGNRVACLLGTISSNGPEMGSRTLRYAPPVHGDGGPRPAATVTYVLTVTSAARDPERAFAAAAAIADAAQPALVMPTRRRLAQQQPAERMQVGEDARQVLLAAAETARAEPLDLDMLSALRDQQRALLQGTKVALQACKDGAAAIDRILSERYT